MKEIVGSSLSQIKHKSFPKNVCVETFSPIFTCGNVLRSSVAKGAHHSCRNMTLVTFWSIFCQSKIREFCIIILSFTKTNFRKPGLSNKPISYSCMINVISLTESSKILEVLKSLNITSTSSL